ncbi:hypothetical protein RF11_12804 [Thelohanellus kitauei]|uniref:Tc1-like transposase DDE domain-containing protein n=1 Tax=Thelohanellus kitauei TaxID=669202 RepID=A0A0C2M2S5_THEKT|nr:hypothetical protein RF11_12804 [Thelohanellus kitauei]
MQVQLGKNTPKSIQERFAYAQTYFIGRYLACIKYSFFYDRCDIYGETGFNLHIRRIYDRSQRGKVQTTMANFRGRNISVSATMNVAGLINYMNIVASYSKWEFVQFLGECLQHLSDSPKIFVLDNIRLHHSIEIPQVLESRGYRVVFLLPYSPRGNPN